MVTKILFFFFAIDKIEFGVRFDQNHQNYNFYLFA